MKKKKKFSTFIGHVPNFSDFDDSSHVEPKNKKRKEASEEIIASICSESPDTPTEGSYINKYCHAALATIDTIVEKWRKVT